MTDTELLFYKYDSFAMQRQEKMKQEIASMDGNRLLNTDVDDLVRYFVEKYRIDPPELHGNNGDIGRAAPK